MTASISEIARSALDVEWRRVHAIATNLANANTTRTADGATFTPFKLLSGPAGGVSGPDGVRVYGLEPVDFPSRLVYEPSHPHANGDGYVAYPGIDHAGEMALLVKTLRVYEANIAVLNAARAMNAKSMEIGAKS